MNQNVFIFNACMGLVQFFSLRNPDFTSLYQNYSTTTKMETRYQKAVFFLNLGTMIVFSDSLVENFGLLLLMIGNIFLSSWSIKAVCRQYEKQLRRQNSLFGSIGSSTTLPTARLKSTESSITPLFLRYG